MTGPKRTWHMPQLLMALDTHAFALLTVVLGANNMTIARVPCRTTQNSSFAEKRIAAFHWSRLRGARIVDLMIRAVR